MKHCKRPFKAFGAVIALAGLVLFTGCKGRRDPEKVAEKITSRVIKELKLNEDQKSALESLKKQVVQDLKEEKTFRKSAADKALAELEKSRVDEDMFTQMLNDRHQRMQERSKNWIRLFSEFHAKLTKEQRTQLAKKLTDIREKFNP